MTNFVSHYRRAIFWPPATAPTQPSPTSSPRRTPPFSRTPPPTDPGPARSHAGGVRRHQRARVRPARRHHPDRHSRPIGSLWVARCTTCQWNPTREDATTYEAAERAASLHNSDIHSPARRPSGATSQPGPPRTCWSTRVSRRRNLWSGLAAAGIAGALLAGVHYAPGHTPAGSLSVSAAPGITDQLRHDGLVNGATINPTAVPQAPRRDPGPGRGTHHAVRAGLVRPGLGRHGPQRLRPAQRRPRARSHRRHLQARHP